MIEYSSGADHSDHETTVTVFLSRGFTQSLPENLVQVESVVLEVNEEEPLQRIFDRAQGLAGTTVPPESPDPMLANAGPELTLSTDPDDHGTRAATPVPKAMVASDGRLKWGHFNLEFGALTVGDLRRSRELGLLDADPDAFVFAAKDPIGNGLFLAWNELQNILITVGSVGGGVTFLGSTIGKVWRSVGRLRRSQRKNAHRSIATDYVASNAWLADFFERNRSEWIARGANEATDFVAEVCRHRQWDAQTLAQVLHVSLNDSRTFLEILGYDLSRSSERYELSRKPKRTAVRSHLLRKTLNYDPATNELLMETDRPNS